MRSNVRTIHLTFGHSFFLYRLKVLLVALCMSDILTKALQSNEKSIFVSLVGVHWREDEMI